MAKNTMELFKDEAPEVAAAFNNLIMAVVKRPALDAKTKQLIYIAMKAAMGDDAAVKAHIPMARAVGATREEVIDAILMTVTVSGIRGVAHCLPDAVEQFEK
jgi:AhpD family alkylhydroperoxidase